MSKQGIYIVIEGHDGTGKTSQRDRLVERLNQEGKPAIGVHEPGQTAIGLALEKMIKDRHLERSGLTNLLLFTANRLELWQQVIEPALAKGTCVVADRNWISSAAYQGFAEGLGIDEVRRITTEFLPEAYMQPDITIFLTITEGNRAARVGQRGGAEADTFESKGDSFQQKVAAGYQQAISDVKNLVKISADPSIEEIHQHIWQAIQPHI